MTLKEEREVKMTRSRGREKADRDGKDQRRRFPQMQRKRKLKMWQNSKREGYVGLDKA